MLILRAEACIRATAHTAHTLPACTQVSPTAAGTASIGEKETMSKSVMLFMTSGNSRMPGKRTAMTHHLFACSGLQASNSAALAGFQSLPASSSDQPEKENCSIAGEGDDQQAAAELPCNKRQKRTPKEIKSPRPPKSQSEAAAGAYSPPDIRPPPEPTEYAKNRPRR
jgi:hypothetical protein